MTAVYRFRRGATITMALDAISGDPVTVDGVIAHLRPVVSGKDRPQPGAQKVADFTVVSRPQEGDTPAGWTLTIAAGVSKSLAVGRYFADAILSIGGTDIVAEGVLVQIDEPATVRP